MSYSTISMTIDPRSLINRLRIYAPSCSLERSERRPARLRCRLDRQSLVVPFLNLEIVGWVLLTRFAISLSDNPKLAIDSINSLVDMSIPVNIHE